MPQVSLLYAQKCSRTHLSIIWLKHSFVQPQEKLVPQFTYEALPPAEIQFVPLKQTESFRADALMEVSNQPKLHVCLCAQEIY